MAYEEVDYDPFAEEDFEPVDHDPFGKSERSLAAQFEPVDFDPWEGTKRPSGASRSWEPEPGALETVGDYLSEIGRQTIAGGIRLVKGQEGVHVVPSEQDAYDQYIVEAERKSKEFQKKHGGDEEVGLGLTKSDFTQTATSLPYSVVGMAAAAPVALLSGPAAPAVALGTSGATMYRMDSAQVMQSYLSALNDAFIEQDGKGLTKEEEAFYRDKFSEKATKHGLWEAIPEAVSNVSGVGMLTKPLAKIFGKTVATRMIGKLGALYGTEMATETISQQGEQPIEVQAGLQEGPERSLLSPKDWWKSAKEVAGPVVIQTSLMGLIGGGAHQISARKKAIGLREVADGGLYKTMPDKVLAETVSLGDQLTQSRPWDKALQASVDLLRAETENRAQNPPTDETAAGAPAPPPGTPPPGPPPGAPAPTEGIGQGRLSAEFFRDVQKALSNGVDNDGQPFTPDHAREIFEAYKAQPGADPVSVAAFERVLGSAAKPAPIKAPVIPETDVPESVGQPLPSPEERLSGFRTFLEAGPDMAAISAHKADILATHPQLSDDLNKAIIEHESSKLEKGGAVNEQVQAEAAVESPQEQAQPTAQNDVKPDPGSKAFVENKIRELGSVEAVNAFYTGKDPVSDYARTMAPKILGVEEQPTEIKAAGTGGKRGPKETITPIPVAPVVKEETVAPVATAEKGSQEGIVSAKEFKSVRDAYSGDTVGEGRIRTPFTHNGQLRTTLGVYGDSEARTFRLIPENEYQGQTYSQQEIHAMFDAETRKRGDDTGLRVSHKGKKYVLAEPLTIKVKQAPAPGEIKAAGTGGKRGPAKVETPAPIAEAPAPPAAVTAPEVKKGPSEADKNAKAAKSYLLEHIDEAITARTAFEQNKTEDAGPMEVLIDVPKDGRFKVPNTVAALELFKKNVKRMKVTSELNKLPQHSKKPAGKSTDLITKEAEAEVADYWSKRNEIRTAYENVPAEIKDREKRAEYFEELERKVEAKEITLKQIGEEAKSISAFGEESWKRGWFMGSAPSIYDLERKAKTERGALDNIRENKPGEIEAQIREFYPGLAKEMFEGKTETTEEKAEDFAAKWDAMGYGERQDIAQASTYGKMRPVVHRLSGSKWAEISRGEQEELRKAFASMAKPPAPLAPAPEEKADIKAEIEAISLEDFDAILGEVKTEEKKPFNLTEHLKKNRGQGIDAAVKAKKEHNLKQIIDAVAKEGVTGASEAMKGLYELFGGSSLKSFPGGFDSDTYDKARPHFEAALAHFIEAGKGLKEFAATIVKQFGDAIKPYLKQFIIDKKVEYHQAKRDAEAATDETIPAEGETEPINLDENTGKGEAGERKTRRKRTDQEKAERDQKKAAAAAEKARKAALGNFQNIGYVYDPEKLNAKIKDKPPKSAAKIILDEMVPGKVFRVEFPEDASPGTVRFLEEIQKQVRTFKDFLFIDSDRLRYAGYRNDSTEKRIDSWISSGGTIDQLKEWAQQYGNAIQPMVDAFKGQSSITNVIGKLQETYGISQRKPDGSLWNDMGTFPEYGDLTVSMRDFKGAADLKIIHTPRSFYNMITEGWQTLLADEADILLSEINVHKRGLNKEISRTGLPDYRNGVAITSTEGFNEPFNFKGVGFGEQGWINQEERSRVVNASYDAFKDLAAVLGAPDDGMSLGHNLAVQYGNLGHKAKGAAAAYFPAVQTINFTRDNGDGTMAHEWGHGLHDLSSAEATAEINEIITSFYHIYDFEAGKRYVDDLLSKDSTFLKRMVSNKRQVRIDAVKDAVRENFTSIVKQETDYYKIARLMDKDYTARQQEMWARAFEAYIYDTLPGRNNYLVNDFVAAGRVGGKSGVGTKLVYPSGREREIFNENIGRFLKGLRWEEGKKPALKDDYVKIELHNEQFLKEKLDELLATVEERYKAIWASEPSADGFYWYRYDETSFAPMMQPDGYGAYDKEYTSEGQNGTGAIAYLTQLHPDVILDYKLTNIQYAGENPTYIKEGGGQDVGFQEDGSEALDDAPPGPDGGTEETGDIRSGDRGSGEAGEPGTREAGKQRGASPGGEGDSLEGIHPATAGNYVITDPALNDPRSVSVRFSENLAAVKILKQIEAENRLAYSGTVTFGTEAPPGGWTEADKVPEDQRTIQPTIDEKGILARYSGWGGMAELFAWSPGKAWAGKAELIKAELTDDELAGAESSSVTSYYTPVPVGQFMWKLAQRLGFKGGVVLDPATGANGLFMGTMPTDLSQSTTLQGIEMDSLSARIASKLYGLATIENKSFQDAKKPNNRYDLTITNVPFESVSPSDTKHNRGGYYLHNYYINKMLDLTAPGALTMAITTSNTMDKIGGHLTEYAAKADLVGAIRLPSGIFSATNVVTDILVFRKKIEGSKFVGIPVAEWTTSGKDASTGLAINNYFINHPEMVAGKLEKITGRYGDEAIRVVGEGDLQQNLERLAASFPAKIVEREAVREVKSIDDLIAAPGTVKEGGLYINDKNEVCLKVNGEEEKLPVGTAAEQKKAHIARGFVHILDQVRATLRAQKTETDDAVVKAEQAKLKKYYDAFVKKFGPVNDPKNYEVYSDATDYAWVVALEEYDPDTKKVTKLADIFTKNITGVAQKPERADNDHDALAYALDEFGYPNLEYMAKLRDSDVATVLAGIQDKVVENPETGFLETMDEYLSGNVKRKLKVAREMAASNPEYERNVKLLEAALPPDVPSHRITARIGASWIKPEHLTAFVREKIQQGRYLETVFNFNPVSNEWTMTFRSTNWKENKAELQRMITRAKSSVEATRTWGTQRRNFFDLIEDALTGKRPVVTVYDPVAKKTFMDIVATKAAEQKLQEIQTEFGQWLFRDSAIGDEAVQRFNDIINTSVPMQADGSHLSFPGKSMWMLTQAEKDALGVGDALAFYPHQANAVWKYLKNGNIYLAHEVGAGKTVTMALIAMEAKRLRGKRKVVYVTLNDSTMGQAVAEIKSLYPLANILPVRVSTNEQRKQRALQKMALNDFDIAIMRQQDLDRIALSPESERVFIEEELAEYREILEEARRNGARIQERDIQERIHALEEKLKAPGVHDEAKRKNLYFDDIGIDLLIVDEAHQYKNVPYATRLTRITGLNPPGSPTAKAFFRKTQYLNATFPKHDALVLASGTALSNSIAEMYNLQRMLQPQEVKRQGVWSFDRWIANYGDMGSQQEWDGARGIYKTITTNRKIVNAGRMLATAYQNIDSVRAKDTPIKRPEIRGGEPQRVVIAPNQYVEDYKQIILDRCANLDADPMHAEYEGVPDNMLRIISNMSKVAIDQRLDSHYANTEMQQDSKLAVASQKIFQRWQEEKKHKGVQLVFADLGTPKRFDKFKYKTDAEVEKLNDEELAVYNEEKYEHENAAEGFNIYDGLKQELIKMGIPRDQIAFIHDADNSNKDKKAANLRSLYKRVNAGDVRVLIGSTSKAGTGVNVQQRVSDIHHLDVWWNYSAWEQRNGRGIRAGNIYTDLEGTYIWNYVTETTVDATRWDKIFAKGKVLNAVLGGDINIDVIEDISEETMSAKMMAAEASGDPLMSTQATLLQDVQNLRFAQAAYLDNIRSAKMELAAIPGQIEAARKNIIDFKKSHDLMEKVTAVRFMGDDRTYVFEKHGKEIIAALEKAIGADVTSWKSDKKTPLLVFGSHTEKEVTEKVEGKEKKVKKYTLVPFPVKASITGQAGDPYGRRILISGDILSSDRQLAETKPEGAGKKQEINLKANISRTVTEYVTMMEKSEVHAKELIEELTGKEPKLKNIIDHPWPKLTELEEKSRQLQEVEQQMAARGQNAGNPETGIEIDKYQSIVPVLDDVEAPDDWYTANGVTYARGGGFGVSAPVEFKNFLQNRAKSFKPSNTYYPSGQIAILNGEAPAGKPTRPIAYTTIKGDSLFWVPLENGDFVTVDPIRWKLMERMLGKDNSWYHDVLRDEDYLVHVNTGGQRDAFIKAEAATAPSGVQKIYDKSQSVMTDLASIAKVMGGGDQYSATPEPSPVSVTLADVQSIFKGQEVLQPNPNSPVYVKTRGGHYLTIETVNEISPDEVDFEFSHGTKFDKETMTIAGAYGDGTVRLVRGVAGKWTLAHEAAGHFLEDTGILNSSDVAILRGYIKGQVRSGKIETANEKDIGGAEDRANFIADALLTPENPKGLVGRVIERVREFLDRLVNAFGKRTARGVIRDVQSGKVFERKGQAGKGGEAYTYSPSDMARGRDILLNKEPTEWTEEEKAFIREKGGAGEFMAARKAEKEGRVHYSVQKILDNKEGYKKAKDSDPPGKDASPETIKKWIADQADLLLQEAVYQVSPDVTRMGFLKKFLTSPEWYDHPVFSRIVRLFVRDRNELYHQYYGHLNNLEQPQMDENTVGELALKLKHKGLNWKQKMTGQASKEYQDVLKIIDEADIDQVEYSEENLKKQGYSNDTITVWKAFRESYDKALDILTFQMKEMIEQIEEEAAFKGMKAPDYSDMYQTLKGALASMGQLRGSYAPRIRQGNWAVLAYKGEGEDIQNYREHRFSHMAATRLASKLKEQGWKIRSVSEVQKLPEDVYQDLKTVSIAKAIEAAADNLAKGKHGTPIQDQALRFNEEILREVADMIKARGFRASMIRRKPGSNVVKGYIEDPIERHAIYTNNISRGTAKAKVAAAATQELMGTYIKGRRFGGIDPKAEPEVYSTAKDYIDEQLRNVDKTDRIIGWAKSLATLKFLGFSGRAALVNMTSVGTTAPAAIHGLLKGEVGFTKIAREMGRSGKDVVKFLVSGRKLENKEEQRFLEDVKKKGWDDAQYTRDMEGLTKGLQNRAWSETMNWAMKMFEVTEKFNRITTMLTAYRLARGTGKDFAESSELAKTASDKSQGIYGRATLPAMAWGRNPGAKMAQVFYVYLKFPHTYLQLLHDLGFRKHDYQAFAYALIAPMVIGGVASWPFKDQWMWLFGMLATILGLKEPGEDLEKKIWDYTRKALGSGAEIAGRYGLLGALGVDISGSLSIGVGLPKDRYEAFGAIGGAVKEVGNAIDDLSKGSPWRAAEHLLPAGLANVARGIREAREGVTTGRKNPVPDEKGRPLRPTTVETALRFGGFRSSRQAALQERMYEGKQQAAGFEARRDSIREMYKGYLLQPESRRDRDDLREIREKIREFNQEVRNAKLKGQVSEISMQDMGDRIRKKLREATNKEKAMMR